MLFSSLSRHYSSSSNPVISSYNHLLSLFQTSINHQCLLLSKKSHAQLLTLGFTQDSFLTTKLISAYSLSKSPINSRLVFDSFHPKNIFLYNTLINGYAKNRFFKEGFHLFNQMCTTNISPDDFTLATLSKMAGELREGKLGGMIHCRGFKTGFMTDTILVNSLMTMYGKCENFDYVCKLFDEMPNRNSASWNVLLSGNVMVSDDLWKVVKQMVVEGVKLDAFTFSSVLPLCGSYTGKCDPGREIHCSVIKNELGFDSDVHLGACLVDMYSKRSRVVFGRRVFDRMSCKNIVAWTAMITGYVQNGCSEEGLVLFREMQLRDGIEPNKVSLVSILPACTSLTGLMEGKQIHGFAIRRELNCETSLCNAIIDMYSKCGSLGYARRVFEDGSFSKDAISWSSIISGYGLNGMGDEAVFLFNKMVKLGIKPDDITLVGALSACARTGLMTEGLEVYQSTIDVYEVSPTLEICACVVDLLGRGGKIDEALDFINAMPVKPGPSVWGAFYNACVVHKNFKMQDLAYESLIQLEPENPSNYISLSNMHASSGRWDIVAELRTRMKDRGLKKLPGCSSINIGNKIHSFHIGDKTHPCSQLIDAMLDELVLRIKVPDDISDFDIFV